MRGRWDGAWFAFGSPGRLPASVHKPSRRGVVAALAGDHQLLVIEGPAGAGKTTSLAAAKDLLAMEDRRLVVVTPTLKAACVAEQQVGTDAFSAAGLIMRSDRWSSVRIGLRDRTAAHLGLPRLPDFVTVRPTADTEHHDAWFRNGDVDASALTSFVQNCPHPGNEE